MLRCLLFGVLAAASFAEGLHPERLARIRPRMQSMVDKGDVAGAVMLVARHGKIALHEAVGFQDVEGHKPMRTDSIFQMMSMTKPVTGVGIMMLVEDGRIALNDPVEKYLPEFKGQMLLDETTKALRKPSRPINIRDLMTHTSGMPAPTGSMSDLYSKMHRPLNEAVAQFAREPLAFEPGTRWQYSNTGIATLGRIIEVASDQSFDRFVATRIFEPLGMIDSFFFAPKEKQSRIALVYSTAEGKPKRADATILGGDAALYRPEARYPAPEFGMYSTARDLFAFYQMMLNGGVFQNKRLLSPASVRTMTMSHTGDLKAGFLPGSGFGLTWEVTKDPAGTAMLVSPGTYSHAGAFGTQGWVDPAKGLVGIFLVQKSGAGSQDPKMLAIQMASAAVTED